MTLPTKFPWMYDARWEEIYNASTQATVGSLIRCEQQVLPCVHQSLITRAITTYSNFLLCIVWTWVRWLWQNLNCRIEMQLSTEWLSLAWITSVGLESILEHVHSILSGVLRLNVSDSNLSIMSIRHNFVIRDQIFSVELVVFDRRTPTASKSKFC